jgi:hypothetical protein
MPADDVQIKWISRVEFAELTGSAASFELEPTGAVSFLFSDLRETRDEAAELSRCHAAGYS